MTPAEEVRQKYALDAEGFLVHRNPLDKSLVGKRLGAGCKTKRYPTSYFRKKHVSVHRLLWLWHHGEWPPGPIDHIDRNPYNNTIGNLRLTTTRENGRNRRIDARNTSGKTGVSFRERADTTPRWRARISTEQGRLEQTFSTLLDACSQRISWENQYNYNGE